MKPHNNEIQGTPQNYLKAGEDSRPKSYQIARLDRIDHAGAGYFLRSSILLKVRWSFSLPSFIKSAPL